MTLNNQELTYCTEKLKYTILPITSKTVILLSLIRIGQYTTQDIKRNPLKTDRVGYFPALSV
ncbi:hypothetical protein S225a_20100 [Candidatus Brocadiaceae bacterium S225]|nr:hypothetical protein S225a_20100 [Candidatus Brocadiaceae bacterium S225]